MTETTGKTLVELWGRFVCWEKRKRGEDGFTEKNLYRHGCKTVYDLALGGGFNSIELLLAGFLVTSNEIDENFVQLGMKNAQEKKVQLRLTGYDWRALPAEPKFDAAVLYGNSFIYIRDTRERKKILKNIYDLLNPGGIFIIDRRNFEYILEEKEKILNGAFRFSKRYIYCGSSVDSYPISINAKEVLFEYLDKHNGKKHHLIHYPVFQKELENLLLNVGFREQQTFYDYQENRPEHHDFTQHLAVK